MNWDMYERCVRWARDIVGDEDAARDIALVTLEEAVGKQLSDRQLRWRTAWRARDYLRRGRIHTTGELDVDTFTSDCATPEEELIAKRERAALRERIGAEAFDLLERSALETDEQIARDTGTNAAAVRKARSRARTKAKEAL